MGGLCLLEFKRISRVRAWDERRGVGRTQAAEGCYALGGGFVLLLGSGCGGYGGGSGWSGCCGLGRGRFGGRGLRRHRGVDGLGPGLLGLGLRELDVDAVGGHVAALHEPLDTALGGVLLGVLLAAEARRGRGAVLVGEEARLAVGEGHRCLVCGELEAAAGNPALVAGGLVGEGGRWAVVGLSEPCWCVLVSVRTD